MSDDVLTGGWAKALSGDLFFDKMLDGFAYHKIVVDTSGKPVDYIFVKVNQAFEQMTDLKREQIIGKKVTDVLVGIEKDPADWIGIYGKVALSGNPIQFENYAKPLDRWYKVSSFSPKKGYFVALFEDITERKKAEERLKSSEERYRSTMDSMLEGCQIIGYDWRYIYINDFAERHNRRPKQELLGKRYMEMWPGIESTNVFAVIKRCLEQRNPYNIENEFTFPDGSIGWFDLRIEPVPEGVFILSIDISERKKAEKALRISIEREHFLAELVRNASVAVGVGYPDGKLRHGQPRF